MPKKYSFYKKKSEYNCIYYLNIFVYIIYAQYKAADALCCTEKTPISFPFKLNEI